MSFMSDRTHRRPLPDKKDAFEELIEKFRGIHSIILVIVAFFFFLSNFTSDCIATDTATKNFEVYPLQLSLPLHCGIIFYVESDISVH